MSAGRLAGITCWSQCHILTYSGSGDNYLYNCAVDLSCQCVYVHLPLLYLL